MLESIPVTIATSGTLSSAANLAGKMLIAIRIPGAITGASLKVLTSPDNVTFNYLYKTGSDLSYNIAASKDVLVSADDILANYLKVESASAEAADRTIILLVA